MGQHDDPEWSTIRDNYPYRPPPSVQLASIDSPISLFHKKYMIFQ